MINNTSTKVLDRIGLQLSPQNYYAKESGGRLGQVRRNHLRDLLWGRKCF